MSVNRAMVMVSAVALDENCNVRECVNCSDEFVKNAVQRCKEMKNSTANK